jgi:cytochrome c5
MNTLKLLPLASALALVTALTACGQKNAQQAQASTAPPAPAADTAAATPAAPPAAAPAAAAETAAPAAATASSATTATTASAAGGDLVLGEKVFGTTCVTCHGAGVLGAPKVGDKTAWGPRVAQGKDTLYTHALNGFKMMPARGGNAALKDEEVKAAIDYMVSKAG